MTHWQTELQGFVEARVVPDARVVVLTGAGISAESGIPTFRGEEGYWTVGSTVYQPQEMATRAAFEEMPLEVWRWYLYRRAVCHAAEPNAAHHALARLEEHKADNFWLVTQNVDNLHLRAGNTQQRTYEIHGNIGMMRCPAPDYDEIIDAPLPPEGFGRDSEIPESFLPQLHCPQSKTLCRPHVLWFDEYYEESLFRSDSAMRAVANCDLLISIGTSGTTSLPTHIVALATKNNIPLIDVNPRTNPFGDIAHIYERGMVIQESAGTVIPTLVDMLIAADSAS